MRLALVIDETDYFHPEFFSKLIRCTPRLYEWVGVIVVLEPHPKVNFEHFIEKHWKKLTLVEKYKVYKDKVYKRFSKLTYRYMRNQKPCTVQSILKVHPIDFITVEQMPLREKGLDYLRTVKPDIVLGLNSPIFTPDILDIPKICCLNRIATMMPDFAAFKPYYKKVNVTGESPLSVSVHVMQPNTPVGPLVAQSVVDIKSSMSIKEQYQRCFDMSHVTILQAVDRLSRDSWKTFARTKQSRSCLTFPFDKDLNNFKSQGGRFF